MDNSTQIESPIIRLPDDEVLVSKLKLKLEEYKERIEPFRAPELQMDSICKHTVLERLLENGEVNTYNLSIELYEKYGSGFQPSSFNNACGVINDYVTTGGENTFEYTADGSTKPRPLM